MALQLDKVKRYVGWYAVLGLLLTFVTMYPLNYVLLLTTAWVVLAWSSLAALVVWVVCYLVNAWVRRARTGKLDQGWLP